MIVTNTNGYTHYLGMAWPNPSKQSCPTLRRAQIIKLLLFGVLALVINGYRNMQYVGVDKGTEKVEPIRGTTSNSTHNPNCALLFFGLVKAENVTIQSIRDNVIGANADCDVFAHTYNVTNVTNSRNGEYGVRVRPEHIYRLTDHVVMDTDDEFHAVRNVTYYRQFFPPKGSGWLYPTSMDNMIKQWHSIERVWVLMESFGRTYDRTYDRVGIFRVDANYIHPISIRYGNAVIPYFMAWKMADGGFKMLNDRMFYGSYKHARLWATTRFDQVETYLRDKSTPDYLHSERFVAWLLRNITVDLRALCMRRVRATGQIKETDCLSHEQMLHYVELYEEMKQKYNAAVLQP